MKAKNFLKNRLREDFSLYFGVKNELIIESIATAWMDDDNNSKHRFNDIKRFLPKARKILDMASGCGTCMYYGLINGYDMYGIDPEEWKHAFIIMKAKEYNYPIKWQKRFYLGFGEKLPFPNNYFDCVTSYQTLEHVQDPKKVIYEMLRVVKAGGGIHIRCPDYRGTFEGHYQLPWLPLFPRPIAKKYLKLLGRPTVGLNTIQYITLPKVLTWIEEALKVNNYKLAVIDAGRMSFCDAIYKRKLPLIPGVFFIYKIFKFIKSIFRKELEINIFIKIVKK